MRWHFLGASVFAFVIMTGGLLYLSTPSLASDDSLIENFYEHRAAYEQLVRMMREDSNVLSVHEDYVILKDWTVWHKERDPAFTVERWKEYKTLFDQLGSPYIHGVSVDGGYIHVGSASIAVYPFPDDYESVVVDKGFTFSLTEPTPLLVSLDKPDCRFMDKCYRKIDENWYLYTDSGISKPE